MTHRPRSPLRTLIYLKLIVTDQITVHPLPLRTNPELRPVWVLFGFLNEYAGRWVIEDSDRVERFFPNESAAAERFAHYLEMASKDLKVSEPFEKIVVPTGHVHFLSRRMTAVLDSMYGKAVLNRTVTLESQERRRCGFIAVSGNCFSEWDSSRIDKTAASERFSYLLGAHIRFGRGNSLIFANATSKAEILRDLLLSIGCPRVSWEIDQHGVPARNTIMFEPTDELREFMSNYY